MGGFQVTPSETDAQNGHTVDPTFQNLSTLFFWTTPAQSRQVTYTYTVSGNQSASATVMFNVDGPMGASVTTPFGPVGIVPNKLGANLFLSFGDARPKTPTPPGITFNASATLPAAPRGQYWWVQLIDSAIHVKTSSTGVVRTCVKAAGGELDTIGGNFPYDKGRTTNDSPALELKSRYTEETNAVSARMYLMWNPLTPGSIVVPLGFVRWGGFGDAVFNSAWSIKLGSPSIVTADPFVPSDGLPTSYPQWSSFVTPNTHAVCT